MISGFHTPVEKECLRIMGRLFESLVEFRYRCLNDRMNRNKPAESDNDWQQVARPGEGQTVCFDLHASMQLADGQLICHTHGAQFHPLSGACLSGSCPRGLYPLEFQDQGDAVLIPVSVEITTGL